MKTQTVRNKIYHAARKKGEKPKKARKIAKDLNAAIIEANDHLVEVDRQALLGELRTGIAATAPTAIRRETGLTYHTINRLKTDPLEDYHPRQSTIGLVALFLDLEIVTKKRGRSAKVVPIRRA